MVSAGTVTGWDSGMDNNGGGAFVDSGDGALLGGLPCGLALGGSVCLGTNCGCVGVEAETGLAGGALCCGALYKGALFLSVTNGATQWGCSRGLKSVRSHVLQVMFNRTLGATQFPVWLASRRWSKGKFPLV